MKVPTRINPQSDPVALRTPYQQDKGVDWSGLAGQVQGLAGDLRKQQDDREEFDLNSEFINHTNKRRLDFEGRTKVADVGAAGFTERLVTDYEAEDQALVARYKDAGYSEKALNRFGDQLGQMRGSYIGQGLNFQAKSARVNAGVKVGDLGTSLSQYSSANPDAVGSSLAELEHNVNINPDLTAPEKQELILRERAGIIMGAGQGRARMEPSRVIAALDPQSLVQAQPGGQWSRGSNAWGNVAVDVANKFGLNPAELAAIMSFETGGTFSPTVTNASGHMGLIQFGKAEQAKYGITKSSTPEQWTNAIVGFFEDRGLQPGASIEDVYSTILTGSPGNYDRTDSNGTSVRNAVPRILSQHLAKGATFVGDTAQAAPATTELIALNADGKTGIPELDLMDAQQRAQVLAWARTADNQNNAAARAAVMDKVANEKAALQATGQSANPVSDAELAVLGPQGPYIGEELKALRAGGPTVATFPTASATEMQAQVAVLMPTDTGASDYQEKMEVYQWAKQSAEQNLAARERDPAAYVAAAYPEIGRQMSAARTVADQRVAYTALQNAYEQLGVPAASRYPLPKEAITQVANRYVTGNQDSRMSMLNEFFTSIPREMIAPFVTQMVESNKAIGPDIGRDSFLYATLQGHPEFRSIMLDAMAGSETMQADSAQRISSDKIDKAWRTAFGPSITLNGAASQNYKQIAAALYVNAGGTIAQGNLPLDDKIWKESMRRAVGGKKNDPNTGIVTIHNAPMVLPPAVTKDQWNAWLPGRTLQDLVNASAERTVPRDAFGNPPHMRDIIGEGRFVMQSPGQYSIQYADGGYLTTRSGHKFIVRITPEAFK